MISQEGRKFKVGLGAISQTPRRMDDITLSQCNSLIALKVINPKDQATIRDSCAMVEERMAQHLPRLNVGQAYFSLADSLAPILVQIERFTDRDMEVAKPRRGEKAPPMQKLAKEY
jgi:DNA helicase HerA-like ATPase